MALHRCRLPVALRLIHIFGRTEQPLPPFQICPPVIIPFLLTMHPVHHREQNLLRTEISAQEIRGSPVPIPIVIPPDAQAPDFMLLEQLRIILTVDFVFAVRAITPLEPEI